ncbi:MAG: SRPBCC family protein [Nannocystaceae bacterium]|nr:SRPBCC family protein [Nannocystaceae bacterium]
MTKTATLGLAALVSACGLLGACRTTVAVGYAPGTAPTERDQLHSTTPPPHIAGPSELTATTVTDTFEIPIEFASKWFIAMPLSEALPGTADVPGVTNTVPLSEGWGGVGARRRVEVKDGSTALEQILESNLPERFRYVVWNYTSSAARHVRYGVGEFRFVPVDGKTRVEWTYAFQAKGWPASWFLPRFVEGKFRAFMVHSMTAMKRNAEQSYREQSQASVARTEVAGDLQGPVAAASPGPRNGQPCRDVSKDCRATSSQPSSL